MPDVEVLALGSDLSSGTSDVNGGTKRVDGDRNVEAPEAICDEDRVQSDERGELTFEMREAALGAASVAAKAAIAAVAVYDQEDEDIMESAAARHTKEPEKVKGNKVMDVSSLDDEDAATILRLLRENAHHSWPALSNMDSRRSDLSQCLNHETVSGDEADLEEDIIADLQRHNEKLRWELRSVLKGQLSAVNGCICFILICVVKC